jgi:hypothetical protein
MASRSTTEVPMDRTMAVAGSETRQSAPAGPDIFEGFVSEEAYAARRGVSIRTCQRDRQLRQSPPYVVIGRRVFYRVEAVRDWLMAREHSGERKPDAPRAGRGR